LRPHGSRKTFVFLIDLVQDVNILAPIIDLVGTDGHGDILVIHSEAFLKRDSDGVWLNELARVVELHFGKLSGVKRLSDALKSLSGRHGAMISASESNLAAHSFCHEIFMAAPSRFTRVTLQHGFECVGFTQNQAHDNYHGLNVTFAADIIASWFPVDKLYSLAPSERSKVFVTGPSSQIPALLFAPPNFRNVGLVCENLHSVRMRTGSTQQSFIDIFERFATLAAHSGLEIDLRPHPGGKYLAKNSVALPHSIKLNEKPLYRQQLGAYAFAISGPSSVLLDLVLAGVPTAVWQNPSGSLSIGNYEGLSVVSTAAEWMQFASVASERRSEIIESQNEFVDSLKIPRDVRDRFTRLLNLATSV